MTRTPSGRKHLQPLNGGPWLVERLFWVFTGMTLGGVALTFGTFFVCAVLLKQPANALSVFLVIAGAMIAVSGPVLGCVAWLANRASQTCPDCLRGMDRGAYVCPWCGFRETPRKEQL